MGEHLFFELWGFPADFVEQHLASIVAKVALLRAQVEPALLDVGNRVDFDHVVPGLVN